MERVLGITEGALEDRDAGFDAGAEVPELLLDPGALNHLQYRDFFVLGEGNVGGPFLPGFSEVVTGAKASIDGHLTGRPLVRLPPDGQAEAGTWPSMERGLLLCGTARAMGPRT